MVEVEVEVEVEEVEVLTATSTSNIAFSGFDSSSTLSKPITYCNNSEVGHCLVFGRSLVHLKEAVQIRMRGGVDGGLEERLEEVLDDVLEAGDLVVQLVDVVQPRHLD